MNDVKVGGIVYPIEIKDDFTGDTGDWGQTNFKKSKITIDSNLDKQRLNQTLVHEIVHCIFEEAGLEQEEDKINRLGIVLHQVLTDNDFSFLIKYELID